MKIENENNTETTATAAIMRIADIKDELLEAVINFFIQGQDISELDSVSLYSEVAGITTYFFEDNTYREEFNTLIQEIISTEMDEEKLEIESIIFCSWIALEVLTMLTEEKLNI